MSTSAIQERWYQSEAVDNLFSSVKKSLNSVAALPTASGKSIVLVKLCEKYLTEFDKDILILSHTKEILKQDYKALNEYGIKNLGLYSAGLDSKEIDKITIAGIQSIYKQSYKFKNVGLVIIDEAHLVSPDDETMYRILLNELDAQFCGLTATPYRLGSGFIYTGENALFNDLCYDLTTFENFNRLVDEGYLSKLVTKPTTKTLNINGLKKVGGDFKQKQMSNKFDTDDTNEAIVKEIIESGKDYKRWLIFAIDIAHAEHLQDLFTKNGILAKCVHSQMDDDRDDVLRAAKSGLIRCIINVDILTTGYDDPEIDLLALIRPTDSPALHVQMIGRGMRIFPTKKHCLVLDFAGNTSRLGPINDIQICDKGFKKKNGKAEEATIVCHECKSIVPRRGGKCEICGCEFPVMENESAIEKLTPVASNDEIFLTKKKDATPDIWRGVVDVEVRRKKGYGDIPDSMMIDYLTTVGVVHEQICYDHQGYPKHKANLFVKSRLGYIKGLRMPVDLDELFKASKYFRKPKEIKANTDGKFHRILDIKW